MKEIFDINLLSQIKGVDKKLSISKEQLQLKRQISGQQKNRQNKHDEKKQVKGIQQKKDNNINKQEIDGHISIDISA